MASEGNDFEQEYKNLEERIISVFERLHRLVDAKKDIILRHLKNLKKSYERSTEADSAIIQLQQFRDAGANLLTSNLLENSKLISLEVIDKQIQDWKRKKASTIIMSRHELFWDESKFANALEKVNLILSEPSYSMRRTPSHSACKLGSGQGDLLVPFYIELAEEKNEVYIADSGNHRVVIHNLEGQFLRLLTQVHIESPRGLALTPEALFVTDNLKHSLYKFKLNGELDKQVGSEGNHIREFLNPTGVGFKNATVYVCDFNNNRIQILDENLNFKRRLTNKELNLPSDIKFSKKYFYILNTVNNLILRYTKDEMLVEVIELKAKIPEAYFFTRDHHKNFLISDKYGNCIKIFSRGGEQLDTLGVGCARYPRGVAVTEDSRIIHVCENKEGAFQIY